MSKKWPERPETEPEPNIRSIPGSASCCYDCDCYVCDCLALHHVAMFDPLCFSTPQDTGIAPTSGTRTAPDGGEKDEVNISNVSLG